MSRLRLELYTTCTPGSHSKLQQSRHLASSIIAMPSVMFKDIGKACSGGLPCFGGRAPQGEIVLSRGARARLRRSAQQGLQDWQVDGRAEDEDARGALRAAATRPAGSARNPNRASVARLTPNGSKNDKAHSPAASSSSTRR